MRWLATALVLTGCAHPVGSVPPPTQLSPAAALDQARARQPERYKMVHQVSARYRADAFVMTGYMLGRKDGSFRVTAAASVGPRLFDVAKLGGVFAKKVYFAPLAEKLDATHIARAIDRIFVADCSEGGAREGERLIYRCPRAGDDEADALEVERDARTLSWVKKTFRASGAVKVTVTYGEPRRYGEEWLPTRVHLDDAYGYALDVAVSEYDPHFSFPDDRLTISD